jgi:hypothetical protein
MPPHDARLADLVQTLEAAVRNYVALGLADSFKATNTVEGSTASEIAQTAVARTHWEAAEKALSDYQAITL